MTRALCRIDWCNRLKKYAATGLCEMHQHRHRNGIPLEAPVGLTRLKFDTHFNKTDGCWEWIGYRDKDAGYGRYGNQWAHRVSYEVFVGPIPDGLVIDHLCRNRGCVNPAHLEPVTTQENVKRGLTYIQDRPKSGLRSTCKRGHALTEDNVYVRPDGGGRQCMACVRIRSARLAEKRRQAS